MSDLLFYLKSYSITVVSKHVRHRFKNKGKVYSCEVGRDRTKYRNREVTLTGIFPVVIKD